MKQVLLVIVFLFAVDAAFAQGGFDAWLNRKNADYDDYLNRNFDDWGKQKRDEYARWKEQSVNYPAGSQQQEAISSFIEQGFAPSSPTDRSAPSGNAPNANAPSGNMPAGAVQRQAPVISPTMKVWVVIVGIAEYNRNQMKLTFTKDDAYRMYAFYKSVEGGSLPDEQITLLLDINATRKNVMQALENMYQKAGKDDAVIFYFAGHGGTGFFCLYEFEGVHDDNRGLLAHGELNNMFVQSQAKYKYIIVEACHSGSLVEYVEQIGDGTRNNVKAAGATARGDAYYQAFEKKEKGFVMMLSSMNEEFSLEIETIRQGAFTYHFLNGLKQADTNNDGIVSVIELYDYVEGRVRTDTNGKQNPVLAGDYDHALPIAIIRK